MMRKEFAELYEKYEPWLGRPVEVPIMGSFPDEMVIEKFLLTGIHGPNRTTSKGDQIVVEPYVLLQALTNQTFHSLSLEDFHRKVRLINLGEVPTVKLSNRRRSVNVAIGYTRVRFEFFMIQLTSNFVKEAHEWKEITKNVAISFRLLGKDIDLKQIPDQMALSALVKGCEPVFYFSKSFVIGRSQNNPDTTDLDMLEISFEELNSIKEDFEIIFFFERKKEMY